MPTRPNLTDTFSDYFDKNPEYTPFAEQANRLQEVPVVENSIEMWQTFRDSYSQSVIFGKQSPDDAFPEAADQIESLVSEG
jgi:multiple sugar transport system substrate-binding protein